MKIFEVSFLTKDFHTIDGVYCNFFFVQIYAYHGKMEFFVKKEEEA